jgi:hypothetical protein
MLPEERLLFMDMQLRYEEPDIRACEDQLRLLSDAGIKTAMMFCTDWNKIEPVKGTYDFSYYDARVDTLHRAGMKVYLQCFTYPPKWLPEDWKLRGVNTVYDVPSPFNHDAWQYVLEFYEAMRVHFNSAQTVVVNSFLSDGETLFPNEPCWYDKNALSQCQELTGKLPESHDPQVDAWYKSVLVRAYMQIQRILVNNPYQEIWITLHPVLAQYYGNGCAYIEDVLKAFRAEFPLATINQMYCTWIQWAGTHPQMNAWSQAYNTNIFGGAEYAEGVVGTARVAKAQNLRGLLIGPVHPHTGHRMIEPWMTDNIRTALKEWSS